MTFANSTPYSVVIQLDYVLNQWSATFGGTVIATNQPIGSPGQTKDLGFVLAEWVYADATRPGDNYMIFDDYRVARLSTPPVVTSQPQSQTAAVGTNISFTVMATGTAPLAYQWRFNGTNLANTARISGAKTNLLSISGVLMSDAGNYSVAISNDGGITNSLPATLTVLKATPLLTWTNPAAIGYGTALTTNQLNAKASVPGSFAYTPALGTVLTAGTNALSVVFTPSDVASYNSVTGVVSQVVNRVGLTVTASSVSRAFGATNPVFGGVITGVVNGDAITASYACSATTSSPAGTYPIVPSLIDPGSRQGNYQVNLGNGTLTVTNSASLSIITQPQSQTVLWGTNATFWVAASGPAPLSYQWRFNGTNLAGANWTNLTIVNVQQANAGNYSVVVSNASGSITSQVAVLSLRVTSIFNSFNRDATRNGPTTDPVFQITVPACITFIVNFHYNSGQGAAPGLIGLKQIVSGVSTNLVGQWQAIGVSGPGGVANAHWYAYPNVALAPGTYLVTDSSRATWSYTTTEYYGGSGPNWAPGVAFSQVEGVQVASPPSSPNYPHNAAEVKQQNPGAPDGEYMIDPDGPGGNPPFSVYCYNMAGTPTEYLTLARVGEGTNYTKFAVGGIHVGTDAYTHWSKLRFNPQTMDVDREDYTFAVSRGSMIDSRYPAAPPVTRYHYGSAADCIGAGSVAGRANINLGGTPFRVSPNVQFILQGWPYPSGSTAISTDRKVVDLQGGGYCGSNDPDGMYSTTLRLSFDPSLVTPAIAPTIDVTGQPRSQMPQTGSAATFAVTAVGTLPIRYQWRFNGVNIANATNTSYTIASAGLANLGSYDVVVANSAGTNTSSAAALALLDLKMLAAVYISATNGSRYRIDAATALAPTNWIAMTNITITSQPYIYVDYASATNSYKFYRAVPQ